MAKRKKNGHTTQWLKEDGQTTQWLKEKKDKRTNNAIQNTTQKTKD